MSELSNNKVIVLGCGHGGLATIRSLGRRGLSIIAVSDDPQEFGLRSKYVSDSVICPHPSDPQALADFLMSHVDEWGGSLLLETTDYFASAISHHKARISEAYHLITPDADITRLFIEKDRTYALADELDIPHPAMMNLQGPEDVTQAIEEMTFPLIIKPIRSHEFFKAFGKKLFIAESVDELQAIYKKLQQTDLAMIIQEIIPGQDARTLESLSIYIDSAGVIRAELFNIKLRQIPPLWGVMRVGTSVPPIDDVRAYSHRLLRAIDFRGYADIEFKRDLRDNLPKLIEVNVRLPQNLQMIVGSGVDLPWLIYQDHILHKAESIETYQPTYYIDVISDLGYAVRREPQKLLNFSRFMKPYFARHKTFSVFSLSDLKPFGKAVRNKFS